MICNFLYNPGELHEQDLSCRGSWASCSLPAPFSGELTQGVAEWGGVLEILPELQEEFKTDDSR